MLFFLLIQQGPLFWTSTRKYSRFRKSKRYHNTIRQTEFERIQWTPRSGSALRQVSLLSTVLEDYQNWDFHRFVRDSSKYWYKPTISREEAINLLRHANPGTFIVRDSTTFKNAYGLVLRVSHPPQGVVAKPGSDELVRHFLVEPTSRGVRLKGCPNEPVFTSLSALVYQHSITPLALPCRLLIPDRVSLRISDCIKYFL